MTFDRRIERDLPELLEQIGAGPAPDYRDSVIQQTATMRQRPGWTFPERWLPMDITTRRVFVAPIRWRPIVVLLVLAALIIATLVTIVGSQRRLPAPYGPAGNGSIVYEDGGDIHLGDPVTGSSHVIVSGPESDSDPAFSFDGSRFMFLRKSSDETEALFIANADGTDRRVLTNEPVVDRTGWDWSGNGRFIVLTSNIGGRQTMSLVDTKDGGATPLDVAMSVSDAVFQPPDGSRIAFVDEGSGRHAIYIVGIDGGRPMQLVNSARPLTAPMFSPDGSLIAYSVGDEASGIEVHIIQADGRNDRLLANPPGVQYQSPLQWSPDGSRLLVARAYFETSRGLRALSLAVVPREGGAGFDLTPKPTTYTGSFGPSGWSPDGTMIVMCHGEACANPVLIDVAAGSFRSVSSWYTASWQRLAR